MAARIPISIIPYVAFMNSTLAYLQANSPAPFTNLNWQRLNWLNNEVDDWESFANHAATLYEQYINKATCPPFVITELNTLIYDTLKYDSDNHLFDRIASTAPSLSFTADFTMFHIKRNSPFEKSKKPNKRHTAIEETVTFSAQMIGSGMLKFFCNHQHNANSCAKPDGFDIEVIYKILEPGEAIPDNTTLLDKHDIFTTAIFTKHFGESNSAKRVCVAMRWFHKTDSPINGPFGPMKTLVIG